MTDFFYIYKQKMKDFSKEKTFLETISDESV